MTGKQPSVLGGTMIIAGTAIGAGMLALPMASAGMWFFWSVGLMLACWLVMLLSSQAILEVNLHYEPGASFHTMVSDTLGPVWSIVNGASVAFVLYILLYAYVSGGSSIMGVVVEASLGFTPPKFVAGLLFALFLTACVWWSAWIVDRFSVVMMGGMALAFIISMFGLLDDFKAQFLLDVGGQGPYAIFIFGALSTYLTSFCFHASVPSLVKYFGPAPVKINKCLVYGTLIALVCYFTWILACDGILARESFKSIIAEGGNVGNLIKAANATMSTAFLQRVLEAFSYLAVATSFLGAGLGLFDYMADVCKFDNSRMGRTKTCLVTFLPPILGGLQWPNGFLYAIGWAGLAATVWSVIIPALMLKASRRKFASSSFTVAGGNATVYLLLAFGFVTALCHTLLQFDLVRMYK